MGPLREFGLERRRLMPDPPIAVTWVSPSLVYNKEILDGRGWAPGRAFGGRPFGARSPQSLAQVKGGLTKQLPLRRPPLL